MSVGATDLAILAAYIAGTIALGILLGRRAPSAEQYTLGGREQSWLLILLSIVATETSTVTFLSIPGFAYGRDLTWLQIAFGFLIGRVIVAHLLLPLFFSGAFVTAYEVLNARFGGVVQRAASVLFVSTRTLADGLRLYLTAIVVQEMTGWPLAVAVTVAGVAAVLYTWYGGLRAVLWTDAAQFAIYVAGALAALWILVERAPGGVGGILDRAAAAGKLRVFDLSLDLSEPYALLAGLVGGIFITLGSHGVDQMMVQRYLSARSLGDARRALVASGFVVVVQFALFLFLGLALWSFYTDHPPATAFDRSDRVFVRYILDQLPVGLVGLLLGAIFAAGLSGSLNSCAATAARDLWRPFVGAGASDQRELAVTRAMTVAFGAAQIAVAIGGRWLEASVIEAVLGIAGFTSGIVLGIFFLGMFARRVGQRAAMIGLIAGFAGMTTIYFASDLAWPWYPLAGSAMTFAAGWAASFIWRRQPALVS
ncbi:MAG TPA: sodium/solute symporter [Thermoanaerobaculia bacterium]|nr:sodium/solute symporter [Thermoanaerobaculia bacterium]